MLPSGNSLLDLVKHLATWEYSRICRTFGHPTEQLPIDGGDAYADARIEPQDITADILTFYGRARAAADQVISQVGLDEVGTTMFGDTVRTGSNAPTETARKETDNTAEVTELSGGEHPTRIERETAVCKRFDVPLRRG